VIERILQLTREMYARAQAGEWEAVAVAEAERDPLIGELFGTAQDGDGGPLSDSVHEGVREILETDRRTMELLVKRRTEVADRAHELAEGERVRMAYEGNSR